MVSQKKADEYLDRLRAMGTGKLVQAYAYNLQAGLLAYAHSRYVIVCKYGEEGWKVCGDFYSYSVQPNTEITQVVFVDEGVLAIVENNGEPFFYDFQNRVTVNQGTVESENPSAETSRLALLVA